MVNSFKNDGNITMGNESNIIISKKNIGKIVLDENNSLTNEKTKWQKIKHFLSKENVQDSILKVAKVVAPSLITLLAGDK